MSAGIAAHRAHETRFLATALVNQDRRCSEAPTCGNTAWVLPIIVAPERRDILHKYSVSFWLVYEGQIDAKLLRFG